MFFHVKELQLLINHSYNDVNLIQPLSFLVFILCFKLYFTVFSQFSSSVEGKAYHVLGLLCSQMIHICWCALNLMISESDNLTICTLAFYILHFPFRRVLKHMESWYLECALLQSDSCSLLGDSLFPIEFLQPMREVGAG